MKRKGNTPGPWTHIRWNDDEHIVEVDPKGDWLAPGKYIAKMGGWDYSFVNNADLISAAPEMLEALEMVLRTASMNVPQTQIVEAVIKKARGDKDV